MDFDAQALRLARRQGGVVTRRQLLDLGASARTIARRVKDGVWVPAGPGVLRLGALPDGLLTRSRAIALAVPGAVLTGPSAAALLGNGPWDGVRLGTRPWVISSRHPGFRARWLAHPGARARRVGGVLVADPATTVVDLLRFLPLSRARDVAYRALQMRVVTPTQLVATQPRLLRFAGASQLRTIVADISTGAHADSELLLHGILTREALTGWQANVRIDLLDRAVVGDVVFAGERLVVEVDGRSWHSSPARFQADRTKQNALVAAGWTVLRFTWEDLTLRPGRVAAEIRATLGRLPR